MWVLCKYDTILYKELDHPHGVWYVQGVLEAMPIILGDNWTENSTDQ